MTRCHSVFSCFSPPCPVHCRLVASERFATREPLVVLRTSGSAPKFPISMILFRLRLTTDLQTMGGRGPRASTVYESQVILSIKDTPLGLKFCRYPGGGNTGPENHRVFHRPPVVARPAAHGGKPEGLIQPAARRLYETLGFAAVGRRARYYRRPVEDAVILRAGIPAAGVSAKL